jgi:hypothetical protein
MALALLVAGAASAEVSTTSTFDPSTIRLKAAGSYTKVEIPGWAGLDTPGLPCLPSRPLFIALPPGHEAVSVRVVPEDSLVLATDVVPWPCQPPAILPVVGKQVPLPAFREPEPSVYDGATPYPRQLATGVRTGYMAGVPVASSVVVPFRWSPQAGILTFYPRLRVEVETMPSGVAPTAPRMISPAGARFWTDLLATLGIENITSSVPVSQDAYDYLIVCVRQCSTVFAELAEWKTRKGLRSVVVTREMIETAYQGEDIPAQVRACIKDYYQNHGVWCALLCGDTDDMPCRYAWAMDCEAGMHPDENDIPADLYFSDLDGTWDANGNGVYGEVADEVDLFPDVIVGRLPVGDFAQAQAAVAKCLEYELAVSADYQDEALFFAEVLWNIPFTDGSLAKDLIDSLYVPASLDPIQKLYETLGNESAANVIAALNAGRNVVNHVGHCSTNVMGCGSDGLYNWDADALANAPRYFLLYSTGCWPAAIDYDCIAEHFVLNPQGGGVAFVGNSRYGWGCPGNPYYGYSDLHDQQFWRNALMPGGASTGRALAAAKTFFIPYAGQENVCRIHQYEVTLLGEPDLPVRTDLPTAPVVNHPSTLATGQTTCAVSVQVNAEPLSKALVCLSQEGGVYARGFTDASGSVSFAIDLSSAAPVHLTVTGWNITPYTAVLPVSTTGAYLEVTSYCFVEASDPANGVPNPGEDLYLSLTLHNAGDEPTGAVNTVATAVASWLTLTDSTESFASVGPGEFAVRDSAYRFGISTAVGLGHGTPLHLSMVTPSDSFTATVPVVVAVPVLASGQLTVYDSGTDGQLDPGETASLELLLRNAGNDTAYAVQGTITSADEWLSVTQGSCSVPLLPPGEQTVGSPAFEVALNAGSPAPRVARILLELDDARWSWQETLWVAVGGVGFEDDMERGDGAWTCAGPDPQWHRSSFRSHSESHAWYCGQEATHEYLSACMDTLLSPVIVAGDNASLSFWVWFDVTVYGTDGLYVEALGQEGWTRLCYLGSGGDLHHLPMGHDWAPYTFDLSWLRPGDQTRVQFVFWSDPADVGEGFYIDDVVLSPCARDTTTHAAGFGESPFPGTLRLAHVAPNPTLDAVVVTFCLESPYEGSQADVALNVYDSVGRLVATPARRLAAPGTHTLRWDLRTKSGERAPSGLYFLRLGTGGTEQLDARRLVVIR